MTIEFTEFVGKAPRIQAIQVTEENVEELAVWMGATEYSVAKTLVGGKQNVVFTRTESINPERSRPYPRILARTVVGDYLMKYPEHISDTMGDRDEKFWSITQEDLDAFVKQQRDNGEIDTSEPPYPPYDR